MSEYFNCVIHAARLVSRLTNNVNPENFHYSPGFAQGSPLTENELSVKWLGTAAYRIEYGGSVLWIDPFFSRQNIEIPTRAYIHPNRTEIDRYMDRADYIAIGHSHYDHAADLPVVVPRTGATVFGSKSVGAVFDIYGLPKEKFHEVTGGDEVEAGPFRIGFVTSEHGKILGRTPYPGDIDPAKRPPLRADDFGCGEVFTIFVDVGGYTIYHQGSGGLIEQSLDGRLADLALIGISSRSSTPRMVYRVVKLLSPRVVMPMHYDQFFFPIDRGMVPVPRLNFRQVVRESMEAAPEAELLTLPLCGEYRVKLK